jgi:hypothetical protein
VYGCSFLQGCRPEVEGISGDCAAPSRVKISATRQAVACTRYAGRYIHTLCVCLPAFTGGSSSRVLFSRLLVGGGGGGVAINPRRWHKLVESSGA